MGTFKVQWEHYEIKWGLKNINNVTFKIMDIPDKADMPKNIFVNPLSDFYREKRCNDPDLFNNPNIQEVLDRLKQEFLDGGGEFARFKISS